MRAGGSYGRVVANQNKTIPSEVGIMKGISLGRPTVPAKSPTEGIQIAPIVVIQCIAGSDVEAGHPILHAKSNPTSHRAKLRMGAANPTRLARARHSEWFGTWQYFTTPQSQINGVLRPIIVIAAQMSTNQEYFHNPAKARLRSGG